MIWTIFKELNLIDNNNIIGLMFIPEVYKLYHNNPYNNFKHAFVVFRNSYLIYRKIKHQIELTKLELFSLLIAALCHDIDHPGITNKNAKKILEEHHVSVVISLMSKHNIMDRFDDIKRPEIIQIISDLILSTNMQYHNDIVTKLSNIKKFNNISDRDKLLAMKGIIKMADLSNELSEEADLWSYAIIDEFKKEAVEFGPDTMSIDLTKYNHMKSQSWFVSNIVLRLYVEMSILFPLLCDFRNAIERRVSIYSTASESSINSVNLLESTNNIFNSMNK